MEETINPEEVKFKKLRKLTNKEMMELILENPGRCSEYCPDCSKQNPDYFGCVNSLLATLVVKIKDEEPRSKEIKRELMDFYTYGDFTYKKNPDYQKLLDFLHSIRHISGIGKFVDNAFKEGGLRKYFTSKMHRKFAKEYSIYLLRNAITDPDF